MKKLLILLCITIAGLRVYSQKGYTEIAFPIGSPIPGSFFSAVAFDDSGNTWMGFGRRFPFSALAAPTGGGLTKWNGNKIETLTTQNSPLAGNVLSLAFANNALWVGTSAGLQHYNRKGTATANWKTYDSLKGKKVLCLKPAGDNLWIGSDAGLSMVDMNNDGYIRYPSTHWGKSFAAVYDITEGDNNELWLATTEGVVVKNGNTYTVFDTLNSGLKTNIIHSVCWKSAAQELWIGTNNGLYRLKDNVILPVEDIVSCFFKAKEALTTVFQIMQEKASGDVLVTAAGPQGFTAFQPSFFKVTNNRIIRYYVTVAGKNPPEFVKPFSTIPLLLAYNRKNELWLGEYQNSCFIIDNMAAIADNVNNIGKITGDVSAIIDVNKVNATVLNKGDMFWDLQGESRYEVPKRSCKSPIFASALWVAGTDAGNALHTAATTYRQGGNDYFAGPLDTTTGKGDSAVADYRKMWKISRWEIEEFKDKYADGSLANGSYTPPADFISWPAHGKGNYASSLAPFVDVDVNGKYEPLKGDYPAIKGELALYWIFNDNTGIHSETGGAAMGIEIHAMAYAYNCDSIAAGSPNEALNYTTFYEYKIINRSNTAYNDAYYGIWTDVDLGNYADDKIGCNIPGNFAFVYNGDNDDEGTLGYGTNPPMLSIVMLSDSMTNFMYYSNDFSVAGNPTIAEHYYNMMRSEWKDGSSLTYGGNGYNTGAPVKHMYPGTPYSTGGWLDSAGGDRRFLQSTGPYNMPAGSIKTFSYAIVYSHEPNQPNGLNTSWAKNLHDVNAVKNWYASQNFPTCPTKPAGLGIGQNIIEHGEVKVVPNPFSGNTALQFNLTGNDKVVISVFNMLGQQVYSYQNDALPTGLNVVDINIANQPAGVYVYKLNVGSPTISGRMVNMQR